MAIRTLFFLVSLLFNVCLYATTEKVVVFFPDKDEKTIFRTDFPKIQFSETYQKYFKKSVSYEQVYLSSYNLDQHESVISDYLSKNSNASVFVAIGIGRYIVDYTFENKNFLYKLCPVNFSRVTTQNELDLFLTDYVARLQLLKSRIEAKHSVKLNFIYLGGQIKPEFFEDKKGLCGPFISNEDVKPFYAMNVINILSKKFPIVYSPLFVYSLFSFYQQKHSLEELSKNFFNMMIPYID